MARTLEQIVAELNPTYDPQVKSLQEQASLIPEQIKAQEAGLAAKQEQAFGNILSGARQRNLGFSGIPLAEQAKYTATEYMPALANLQTAGKQQAMSLQDAINQIYEKRNTLAQQLRQTELDREQSAAQAAAQRATFGNLFGGTTPTQEQAQPTLPKINRDSSGGFQFTDAYGKPINALEYVQLAQLNGQNIGYRELLSRMAAEGDSNARIALQYVGNDAKFGNAPAAYQGALSALGATGSFQQEARPASSPIRSTSVLPTGLVTLGTRIGR